MGELEKYNQTNQSRELCSSHCLRSILSVTWFAYLHFIALSQPPQVSIVIGTLPLFFIGFFSPTAFWDFCSVFPMWHTKLLIKTRNRKPNNAQDRDILTKNIQLWDFQLCNKHYTHFTDTTLHCYITATIHFCFCSYCKRKTTKQKAYRSLEETCHEKPHKTHVCQCFPQKCHLRLVFGGYYSNKSILLHVLLNWIQPSLRERKREQV